MKFLFLATCFAFASLEAAEPVVDIFVSTGDNHFLGSSMPIDSPASIEATFNVFKEVNHARRIYWRGLEEASWVETMDARAENPRMHSLWNWLQQLYREVDPDKLAVQAAHSRGMEIWGVGSLWDWGAPADTPGFGDYPFTFESKLKLAHPEWAPVDKHGARKQGGPIELAYAEARRALVELTVRQTLKAGYDGIVFLSYVENYSQRFQDEFGYSDPIVRDFQKLHGIDLRREPFKRGASREDWMRLRGSYVTAFLRELKAELAPHGIKLGMIISPNDPHQPQSWNVPELMLTAGSHYMDLENWVAARLVDALVVYGNCSPQAQSKAIDDLRWLTRETPVEISFITSGPFRAAWKAYQEAGVPTVLAVSDDAQHLERGFVPAQTKEGLQAPETPRRLRGLQQVVAGQITASVTELTPALASPDLIERRLALQALGKMKSPEAVPLLERALNDPENGVRCIAALALAETHGATSCRSLIDAVAAHGNHMLRECAVIALRRLKPAPVTELGDAALHSASAPVREVAMRALVTDASAALLPIFRQGLKDQARFPRYAATEALGNVSRSSEAIDILLGALNHHDPVVVNRAAVSLGNLAKLAKPETAGLRPKMLAALVEAFRRHGSDSKRADAEWGWRPIGNSLLDCGEEGVALLREIRDQRADLRLAELAWRVVDLTQRPNTFSEVTQKEEDAALQRRPPTLPNAAAAAVPVAAPQGEADTGLARPPSKPAEPAAGRALYVDPEKGDDHGDGSGKPLATIDRAIKLARAGDTIHLLPRVYRAYAGFYGKQGEPGRPIALDGHGAILEGSDPIDPAAWREVAPGLFQNADLPLRLSDAVLVRWFFLFDGKMQLMGRSSKGPKAALKEPSDLLPGEWTFVKDASRAPAHPQEYFGTFFLKLAPGQQLADAKIAAPMRSAGVQLGGANAHLVIRNLTATHPYNDGFNIHGDCRDVVFENIAAIECGDDGFSAHETAECHIDGFVSIGNSTGLCDTVSSETHYKNVFIRDCHGYDIFFIGDSPHSLENVVVESSAPHAIEVGQHTDRPQKGAGTTVLRNLSFHRIDGQAGELRVSRNARLELEHCTLRGVNMTVATGGGIALHQCLLQGAPKPNVVLFPDSNWQGEDNVFDLATLRVDKTNFTPETFLAFQKLTGGDQHSHWNANAAPDLHGVGADQGALMELEAKGPATLQAWRAAK